MLVKITLITLARFYKALHFSKYEQGFPKKGRQKYTLPICHSAYKRLYVFRLYYITCREL